MMTLEQFISGCVESPPVFNRRLHLDEPKYNALYVRYTQRYFGKVLYKPVLDIASVEVAEEFRGKGLFGDTVERIRAKFPDLHIFVENAQPKFGEYLLRAGFAATPDFQGIGCYLLAAGEPFKKRAPCES